MLKRIFVFGTVLVIFFTQGIFAQGFEENKAQVFTLSNGMKVILKEKHANPVISSMIYVNAGSKYETDYNNGATHLLEHLLFDGTKRRTREQISEEMKSKGSSFFNAFTRKELTCYLVIMPKEFIEDGLDVQSDMLFNSIFPDSELAKERNIVIEEIKKDEDNVDYQVEKFFDVQAYPGTPYARPVLGYENIIATIPKEDIIQYYQTYYKPNNMAILLIGDFETDKMLKLVEKYFGNIPVRPLPPLEKITYTPPEDKVIKYKEVDTKNCYLNLSFKAPHLSDADYFAFDLLTRILSSGETSPLYQALTQGKEPLIIDLSASVETQKEFSTLNISILTDSPQKIEKILAITTRTLKNLTNKRLDPVTVKNTIVSTKADLYYQEEKLYIYGMTIAPILVNCGYDFLESYIPNLETVTPDKIQKVSQKYFSEPKYVATAIVPKVEKKESTASSSQSKYMKEILPNGLEIIIRSNPDSKVFALNILGKNRTASEPEGRTGVVNFINSMLAKGTTKKTAEKISQDIASIGGQLKLVDDPNIPYDDIYTSRLYSFIRFETLDEFADQGVELLSDLVKNSKFPQDEVEKIRAEILSIIKRENESTSKTCSNLFYAELFKDHPYGKTVLGDENTISSITQTDLIDFHKKFYSPKNMILTVVTSLPPENILSVIKTNFGDIPPTDFSPPSIPQPKTITSPAEVTKEMKKEQVYIYLGNLLPGIDNPEAPALEVANSILSSRLGLNLREKKGLAYSVGSSVNFDKDFGWFIASIGTRPKNYKEAFDGILNEMNQLKENPVDDNELETAKNSLWGNLLFYRLSRINQAYYMGVNEFLGAGYDYDEKHLEKIRAVTKEQVKEVVQKYLDTKNYVLAVVGKKD
ncbi:MAG: insulinase family protein [candidate division Zixibacteria bacterium]|nr:insulinase family protein [candidate division Zixibacteria bacterium]